MTKLFVGGLTYAKTTQDLQALFAQFGAVQSAQVITDKYTNQSKGFGFVEMASDDDAKKAIQELDGTDLDGRRLNVSVAKPREERSDRGGFNRDRNNNSRGGYNSGGFNKSRNRY